MDTPTGTPLPTTTGRIPRRSMFVPGLDDTDEDDTLVGEIRDDTTFDPACLDASDGSTGRRGLWLGLGVALTGCGLVAGALAASAVLGGALWLL